MSCSVSAAALAWSADDAGHVTLVFDTVLLEFGSQEKECAPVPRTSRGTGRALRDMLLSRKVSEVRKEE